ncbi:hypothetical protein DYB30_010149 [Aphanomyces astaci]|uniref:Uncharacterized protein n=2 Tax=Aphanomyces astaci TaxID=112090 RepID=A0A397CDZ6_APHAT|nr:hypothetical protein DYB30_010149 [Aphanomyces astaci]
MRHEPMVPATWQRLTWWKAVDNLKNGSRLLDVSFAPDGMTIRFHAEDPGHQVSNELFRTFDYQTKQFATLNKLEYNINQFEMFKNYEPTDESLARFADDMVLWHNEILNAHILKRLFDYFSNYKYRNSNTKYANHANQVHLFMKYHLADVTQYDTITLVEADW